MIGILKSLGTAVGTALRKPVTVQYPSQHREIPERERAFPILLYDQAVDEPFCTGCQACSRACPVECMTVVMKDNPKFKDKESKRRKIVEKFWIDYGRCMKCNICVEVCNFEAIAMNNTWSGWELARYDRRDLVMDVDDLLRQSKESQIKEWVAP